MDFDMIGLIEGLNIMGQGMLGIFVAVGAIMLVVKIISFVK